MRQYSPTEIRYFEQIARRLAAERRTVVRETLQTAFEIMTHTSYGSQPHEFADGVAAATVKDCRRYPTARQAWWLGELHRQVCSSPCQWPHVATSPS